MLETHVLHGTQVVNGPRSYFHKHFIALVFTQIVGSCYLDNVTIMPESRQVAEPYS